MTLAVSSATTTSLALCARSTLIRSWCTSSTESTTTANVPHPPPADSAVQDPEPQRTCVLQSILPAQHKVASKAPRLTLMALRPMAGGAILVEVACCYSTTPTEVHAL